MDYETMAEAWGACRKALGPSNAPEIIEIMIKRSFYIGAGAMLKMILLTGSDKKDSKEFRDFCVDLLVEITSVIEKINRE